MKKKNILLLYLATGGGHISAARALARDMEERYPAESAPVILDGINPDSGFQKGLVEGGYRFSASRFPFLWIPIFEFSRAPFIMNIHTLAMRHYSGPYLAERIRELKPDRIVVLHFLLVRPLRSALQKLGWNIPSITVVTDPFIAHPLWLYRQWMPLIVFSDSLKQHIVKKYHIEENAVSVFPPILRREYRRDAAERDTGPLKETLGFPPDKPLILIAGGGEGLPGGEQFLKAVLASSTGSSVAFVCGKNNEQQRHVRRIIKHFADAECRVYGFIDFMFDLMRAADIVVTKAGPATIMEALILEKPLILTEYIYGQERGNVDFVLRNGLGYFVDKPREILKKIQRLIGSGDFYRRLRKKIDRCRIENGTEKITDFILHGKWERYCR